MTADPLLRVTGLTVRRGGRVVLADVSLSLHPGDVLCLIGPNGAGKTTLMLASLGLLAAEGTVTLRGHDVRRLSRASLARLAALVPQAYEGFLGVTVRSLAQTARLCWLNQPGQDHVAAVDHALASCDLAPLADRALGTLSAGQRQLALLAAALAQQTPLLMLDEPTANLDPAHQRQLLDALASRSARRALVIATHDLSLPARMGSRCRVLALQAGQALAEGPADLARDLNLLQRLFHTPFAVRPVAQWD